MSPCCQAAIYLCTNGKCPTCAHSLIHLTLPPSLPHAVAMATQDMSKQLRALPALPEAPNASLYLMARLERVWDMLAMPLTSRLDMVLHFTQRERALTFEKAMDVSAWLME